MMTCRSCEAKIEDVGLDCPVCGASPVKSGMRLKAEPGEPAYRGARGEPARTERTTHRAAMVQRYELGPARRPQCAALHDDALVVVLSIDRKDRVAIDRFALDGRSLGGLGQLAMGDSPDAIGGPAAIALDGAGRVHVLDSAGKVVKLGGEGAVVASFEAGLSYPRDFEVARDGAMVIADTGNHRVVLCDPDGHTVAAIGLELDDSDDRVTATPGTAPGELDTPSGVAVDPRGTIYVADTNNHRIQAFGRDGGFLRELGAEGDAPGRLRFPTAVRVGPGGELFVLDRHGRRIQKLAPDGALIYGIPVGATPTDVAAIAGTIAVGPDERIYLSVPADNAVVCLRVVE
jgi:DNA-binding beta-propeller fold protein YncE